MTTIKPPLYIKKIRSTADTYDRDNVIGYALCDMTGATIIPQTTRAVCNEIMTLFNKRSAMRLRADEDFCQYVLSMSVPIEPMEKPLSHVVTVDRRGNETVGDHPEYVRYIKRFVAAVKESGVVLPDKPINYRCQVIIVAYASTQAQVSIPAYAESTLDCLVACGVLKNKGYRIVNNIDGSRVYCDEKRPRVDVFVRRWTVKGEK